MRELRAVGLKEIEVSQAELEGAFAVEDIVNTETGEVIRRNEHRDYISSFAGHYRTGR